MPITMILIGIALIVLAVVFRITFAWKGWKAAFIITSLVLTVILALYLAVLLLITRSMG